MTEEEQTVVETINNVIMNPRDRFFVHEGEVKVDLREIAEYFKLTQEEATTNALICRPALADEFKKKNPLNQDELYNFYKETPWQTWDLFTWTHDDKMWKALDILVEDMSKLRDEQHKEIEKDLPDEEKTPTPPLTVLDYGCGIGDVSIYLALKGCVVTAVDIPQSITYHFCQWRIAKREMPDKIKFWFDMGDPKFQEQYDIVLAIDVLEHLMSPLRYVVQLGELLKDGDSCMVITPTFNNDTGIHPMHLQENFWLMKTFGSAMLSLGFMPGFPVDYFYPVFYPYFKGSRTKLFEWDKTLPSLPPLKVIEEKTD